MAMSDDLFMAILSMDAYNRRSDAGLQVSGSQIGNATIRSDALPSGSSGVSFSAEAYTWNGTKVISYCGTDSPLWDALKGWTAAIGFKSAQLDHAASHLKAQLWTEWSTAARVSSVLQGCRL